LDALKKNTAELLEFLEAWLTSIPLYVQLGYVAVAILFALIFSLFLNSRVAFLKEEPSEGRLREFRLAAYRIRELIFPIFNVLFLGIAAEISGAENEQAWMIRICQGLAVIFMVHRFIRVFINNRAIITLTNWIGTPVALLFVFGWLDEVTGYLDSLTFEVGNLSFSAYAITRTLFFGFILFWLGRFSNTTGKRVIRNQPNLDLGTREVLVKLFEIALFTIIFLLILQVMGINLTALAVFGGALGVGLGFGLQQIAANFVSGIIILLDRSVTIGDFIQLEDGRSGTIRELSMRSATLETYDGKDIMVPNEQFITTSFTNWTHNNQKQRYPITFQVAYDTDLEKLFPLLRDVVSSHPSVLSGDSVPYEERPDAEIAGFGDSGIDILVEFWMEGIDDGKNRVGGDLLMMIWTALKQNDIHIPFPQREVKLLNEKE
jgi:small-conductance mechanosensitive channel